MRSGTASVEITRSSACGDNCASCGLCPGRNAVVEARCDVAAAKGDAVEIYMSDKNVLGAAFLVYIIPLLFLIGGYFAGDAIFKSEIAGVICGFALMAAVFAVIICADKRLKRRYTPHVVRVIPSEDSNG